MHSDQKAIAEIAKVLYYSFQCELDEGRKFIDFR